MQNKISLFIILSITSVFSYAAKINIIMFVTNKSHTAVGFITATDTKYGVMFTPHLTKLPQTLNPGRHGFHIHENHSCANSGMAAGGHLDPQKTGAHLGPYNPKGHLGDLPAIYINTNGTASNPVIAPRLKVKDILGYSLVIHSGNDNYSDIPKPLGGGGSRIVCGLIPEKIAR
ncbi:MAG: superoxide dismutase family protein [Neisseriaceae bacterium]